MSRLDHDFRCESPCNNNLQTPCIETENVTGHNDEDETIASEIQDFEHDDRIHDDTRDTIAEDLEDVDVVLRGDNNNLASLSREAVSIM